ncbi:low temperature requirement protein A [Streptomyces sp. NPDC058401]|uniref:low temperature requirement protein A n=1 Tax=Streptomyces sp. NPDC058401 TaxID=3346480 RepID=UPI003667AD1F
MPVTALIRERGERNRKATDPHTLILMLAVWPAWVATVWFTNFFDLTRRPVKRVLLAVMPAALVMAAALPEAFTHRAAAFAGAYPTLQIGRQLYSVIALRGHRLAREQGQRTVPAGPAGLPG